MKEDFPNWQAFTNEWLDLHHLAKLPERAQMIIDLSVPSGSKILDVGSGSGSFTGLFSRIVPAPKTIVSLDLSIIRLEKSRVRLDNNFTHFVCGNLEHLPFSNTFDLVWCANTLQYCPNPVKAIQNMINAARGGATIVVKDEDVMRDILLSWDPELELEVVNAWYKITKTMDTHYWNPFMGRKLVGLLRTSQLQDVKVKTYLIERSAPVSSLVEQYITKAFWYYKDQYHELLSAHAWKMFCDVFNPSSISYLFKQNGFHFISTETVVSGKVPDIK